MARAFVDQVAAAWLLSCVFVRTLEDRGLLEHPRLAGPGALDSQPVFFEIAPSDDEPQELLDGSARLALQTHPPFDRYEQRLARCAELESRGLEIASSSSLPRPLRDAGGVEAIAKTKAIDLWLLFPLGMGVNRLLTKSGDIPDSWRRRLNLLLGTEDWYDEFYKIETQPGLFGQETERVVKASMETIGKYFNDRLKNVFAGVAEQPAVLENSSNNPLFLFCFAVGNASGKDTALRIANHLLKEIR